MWGCGVREYGRAPPAPPRGAQPPLRSRTREHLSRQSPPSSPPTLPPMGPAPRSPPGGDKGGLQRRVVLARWVGGLQGDGRDVPVGLGGATAAASTHRRRAADANSALPMPQRFHRQCNSAKLWQPSCRRQSSCAGNLTPPRFCHQRAAAKLPQPSCRRQSGCAVAPPPLLPPPPCCRCSQAAAVAATTAPKCHRSASATAVTTADKLPQVPPCCHHCRHAAATTKHQRWPVCQFSSTQII